MMQPYQSHEITAYIQEQKETMSLEQCVIAWLDAKKGRSGSEKTYIAYHDTLTEFRDLLKSTGRNISQMSSFIQTLHATHWPEPDKVDDVDLLISRLYQQVLVYKRLL